MSRVWLVKEVFLTNNLSPVINEAIKKESAYGIYIQSY